MKLLLLLALSCAATQAQSLTFSIHDNSGASPDTPLPAAYPFASTPVGGSSSILVKATNSGSNPIEVALIYIGSEPGTSTGTPNFTVTGLDQGHILAPGRLRVLHSQFHARHYRAASWLPAGRLPDSAKRLFL